MGCNNAAGPCDNMLLRISEFEENDGTGVCGYNPDGQWNEIRITTDKCWLADEESSTYVEGRCEVNSDVPSASYNMYFGNNGTCAGDADYTLPLQDGGCYDFQAEPLPMAQPEATGNYSNIRILSCNGEFLAPDEVIPDCKYVESPSYMEQHSYWNGSHEIYYEERQVRDDGFKVPIGECMTSMRADEDYPYSR